MRPVVPLAVVAGVLFVHLLGAPALAGSVKTVLTVSARVLASCRLQDGRPVCTKGSVPPRTEVTSVTVSETGDGTDMLVTVNY
jgi:hypothetical protein